MRAVQADRLLERRDWDHLAPQPLAAYRRVVVAAVGKAAMAMAGVVEAHIGDRLGDRLAGGCAVVPHGYAATLPAHLPPPRRVAVVEAGHPVPDAASVAAAQRVLALAHSLGEGDLFVVLLSGGGSALCTDFADGVTLDDARATFRLLLESGADIHAVNAVRKHLSRVGGGGLARAAHPADVVALAVSDVPGDDLSVIASGPTVPDPTTFADAVDVLRAHGLWERVPPPVRRHLDAGLAGARPETPKPGDRLFERVRTEVVGTNRDALAAAAREAAALGFEPVVVSDRCTGEAREVGRAQATALLAREGPACLLWGGETTVTVRGRGRGGRNQELALAAALVLDGSPRDAVVLSAGTDGVDGPTDAAGARATPQTAAAARAHGLDPQARLDDNDAYTVFDRVGGLLRTGPTHTNVMDLQVALVR